MPTSTDIRLYTVFANKEATLFSTITLVFLGGFLYFLRLETGTNTAQLHVIYLLNGLMTSYLWDIARRESFPNYNVGCEKCSTLLLNITVASLDRFWLFCIIGNRDEYSTKQLFHFNLTMSPLYLIKLKIAQKQPTAYCSIQLNRLFQNFTESRSMFVSFRICLNIPLAVFQQKSFTLSLVLSKIYLETQYG